MSLMSDSSVYRKKEELYLSSVVNVLGFIKLIEPKDSKDKLYKAFAILILLVSSSRFQDLWIVPGGGLEPGEDPATTAVREVNEEAGVIGKLGRLLDVFENNDRKTRTYVYVLVVEQLKEDYDDANKIGRLRKWFSVAEANRRLSQHKPVQQEYIDKLINDQDHQRRVSMCTSFPERPLNLPLPPTEHRCTKCRATLQEWNEGNTAPISVSDNNAVNNSADEEIPTAPPLQTNNEQPRTEFANGLAAKNLHDVRLTINNSDMKAISTL